MSVRTWILASGATAIIAANASVSAETGRPSSWVVPQRSSYVISPTGSLTGRPPAVGFPTFSVTFPGGGPCGVFHEPGVDVIACGTGLPYYGPFFGYQVYWRYGYNRAWGWPWVGWPYTTSFPPAPLIGTFSPIDPALQVQTLPAPPVDLALEALRSGQHALAAAEFGRRAASEPDEPEHLRRMALALLGAGNPSKAAEQIAAVYALSPDLADRPLDGAFLAGGRAPLRSLLLEAVAFAHSAPAAQTANAWLLVAVVMQAEGRNHVAARMLERAALNGLDAPVLAAFEMALIPVRRAASGTP